MILDFTPAGYAHCLYDEAIDLHQLGPLKIERASMIEFNATTQHWEVRLAGGTAIDQPAFSHASRQACLDWERAHLMPA